MLILYLNVWNIITWLNSCRLNSQVCFNNPIMLLKDIYDCLLKYPCSRSTVVTTCDNIDRKHWLLYFFSPNSIYTWLGKEQLLILQAQAYSFTASVINEAVQRKTTDFSELTGTITEVFTVYEILSTDMRKEACFLTYGKPLYEGSKARTDGCSAFEHSAKVWKINTPILIWTCYYD